MPTGDESGLPLLEQAEAYLRDDCVLIRNERTARIADLTREHVQDHLTEVPNASAFLDVIGVMTRGSNVVITLGDSTTANFTNWPRVLARSTPVNNSGTVVLNLADWDISVGDHIGRLQRILPFLREREVKHIDVVFFGGLLDWVHRRIRYEKFIVGGLTSPLILAEIDLEEDQCAVELTRVTRNIPSESNAVDRWIVRRILAVVRMLRRICADAKASFIAVLQPLCFDELVPAYRAALNRQYEEARSPLSFVDWCREHRYYPDLTHRAVEDWHLTGNIRSGLELLSSSWHELGDQESTFIDFSGLFRFFEDCPYDNHFDAVHLESSGTGIALIAETIAGLLKAK
jgi:hypothetical protein